MADSQLSLPGQIVKKDNRLIRTRICVDSVDAGRILANLISCIRVDDRSVQDSYSVAAKDFLTIHGGEQYRRIKSLCRELAKATAEVEEPDPNADAEHPVFTVCPFFSRIRYSKGIVTAVFNPVMAPYLLQLKSCFTQYNLIDYLQLPSIYSQRIFEILKSWQNIPEVIISVSELHKILNTPESFRANFKEFRRRVLEKSHSDILEKTDFCYEWEPIKVGHSVEKIRFIFSSKKISITEKEKDKVKQEKQVRLRNARFVRAVRCFEAKGKECREQTEKRIVCKLCREMGICTGNLKETAK